MLQQLGLILHLNHKFIGNNEDRDALLKQAEEANEGHAVVAAGELYHETADDREVTEEDHEDDITEVEEEQYAKRYKHDPLLEFQNSVMGERPGVKLKKSARDLKTEVFEEVRRYKCMGGVSLHMENAARIILFSIILVGEQ